MGVEVTVKKFVEGCSVGSSGVVAWAANRESYCLQMGLLDPVDESVSVGATVDAGA